MQGVQALNPSSPSFLREEAVLLFAEAYDSNIEDLKHELHQTRRILDRKKVEKESPTTLMEFTQFLDPYQDVFYEMFRLCKIVVVLPVSSASCERSFSSLRLIKTYLRSTMTEKRLSSLAVLKIVYILFLIKLLNSVYIHLYTYVATPQKCLPSSCHPINIFSRSAPAA
uniref:HAT C-terminal dimerisation domain-containing protein n=1 Tax=Amphiprion percula TaxID=161767 RepID=A0A3P8SAP0_AMPPE